MRQKKRTKIVLLQKMSKRFSVLSVLVICLLLTSSNILVKAMNTDHQMDQTVNDFGSLHQMKLTTDFYLKFLDQHGNPVSYTPIRITTIANEWKNGMNNFRIFDGYETTTNEDGVAFLKVSEIQNSVFTENNYSMYTFFVAFPSSYGVQKAKISNLTPDSYTSGNFYYDDSNGGLMAVQGGDSPGLWMQDGDFVDDYMGGLTLDYDRSFNSIFLADLWYYFNSKSNSFLQIGERGNPVEVTLLDYTNLMEVKESFLAFDPQERNADELVQSRQSSSVIGGVYNEVIEEITTNGSRYKYYGYNLELNRNSITRSKPNVVIHANDVEINYYYARSVDIELNPNNGNVSQNITRYSHESFNYWTPPIDTSGARNFTGWNTQANGMGVNVTSDRIIRTLLTSGNNLTLYAQWSNSGYSVSFDRNGGIGSMDDQIFRFDEPQPLSFNTFSKDGYTFTGWNTQSNGLGTPYNNGEIVYNLTLDSSMTLYAQWSANPYIVNYHANSGTGNMSDQTFTYDQTQPLKQNEFAKTGYTFTGWNTQSDGQGTPYSDSQSVSNLAKSGNVTLYAQWRANEYTVVFDSNDGTGETTNQVLVYDSPQVLNNNSFSKTGYTFTGWNTQPGGDGISFGEGEEVSNLAESGTVTLYAQWTANSYTVSFEGNTGQGNMNPQGFIYDISQLLSINTYTKTGYTFTGWNTKANGDGVSYTDQEEALNLVQNGTLTLYAQWQPNSYTVNYDGNSGIGSMNSQILDYDQRTFLSSNSYTRAGYTFMGWNTQADGNGISYADEAEVINLATEGSITLYAQWNANGYIIEFNPNTGIGIMSDQAFIYDISQSLSMNTYTKTGYTFAGWNTQASGDGVSYTDQEEVLNLVQNGTLTLYAQWQPNSYTVNYDGNSGIGSMNSQILDYDQRTFLSSNSYTRAGYTFMGWNTQADGNGISYADEAEVINLITEGSITLYAQWNANGYIIEFNPNTGIGNMNDQTFTYDQTQPLKQNEFAKTGYTFTGWNTQANGDGVSYTDQQEVINLVTEGSITLYAQWNANDYVINFDGNTGTGSMDDQIFRFDEPQPLSFNTFSKDGYTFTGWNTQSNGLGTPYNNGEIVYNLTLDSSMTLYAQWSANPYIVNYHANSGTGNMSDQTFTYDQTQPLKQNEFAKTGYTFTGWNTQSDGQGTPYSDSQSVSNLAKSGNVTLYAQWSANEYTVVFDSNDGTGETTNQVLVYDAPQVLNNNSFTKTGYIFMGWNTQADGNGISYADGAEVINLATEGSITLYAQWNVNDYVINFDGNTGTGSMDDQIFRFDEPQPLSFNAFSKDGYTFTSWNTQPGGDGISFGEGEEVSNLAESGTVTLYAQWTANSYTVSFEGNTGQGNMNPQGFIYDISQLLSINTYTKTGYTFTGWNTKANGDGVSYTDQEEVLNLVQNGTLTLYAQWQPNSYTVIFDGNAGLGDMGSQSFLYDDSQILTANIFTKTGYTFVGWNAQADGNGASHLDEGEVLNLATDGEVTLYAQWAANEYIIVFESNSGQGMMDQQTLVYDAEQSLSLNLYHKEGHIFSGWNTQSDGKGISYADAMEVLNLIHEGSVTLYAQWEESTIEPEEIFPDEQDRNLPDTGSDSGLAALKRSIILIGVGVFIMLLGKLKKSSNNE